MLWHLITGVAFCVAATSPICKDSAEHFAMRSTQILMAGQFARGHNQYYATVWYKRIENWLNLGSERQTPSLYDSNARESLTIAVWS